MEKKKSKSEKEAASPLREPKAKKTLGLKVPVIQMPHLELVPQLPEKVTPPSQTTQTSISTQTRQSRQTRQTQQPKPVAPTRDFQKVPNSHTKKAIPEGFFKPGKAKHLYDVLYSLTRGAVEPARSIRISKSKLMKKAGIGSRITFDSIISNFETTGLVKVTVFAGEHEGNEFEIFTYDEIETATRQTRQSSQTGGAQKLDGLVSPESSQTSQSLNEENKTGSAEPKTFFKTLSFGIDDDAPVRSAFEQLNEAARAATGRDLTGRDWEAFGEIVELLVNETAVARSRTGSVSVYLKFAAENLRRRLYAKRAGGAPKTVAGDKPGWVGVGRSEPDGQEFDEQGNFIPKPLDEDGRAENLEILLSTISFGGDPEQWKHLYTAEDWQWLNKRLDTEKREREVTNKTEIGE